MGIITRLLFFGGWGSRVRHTLYAHSRDVLCGAFSVPAEVQCGRHISLGTVYRCWARCIGVGHGVSVLGTVYRCITVAVQWSTVLGFSWEAAEVKRWSGESELAAALSNLTEQRLSTGNCAMVQDYVDFDVELRQFFVECEPGWDDEADRPRHVEPTRTLYTRFRTVNDGRFTDFERLSREKCCNYWR
eukprot:gene3619-biopygen3203